MNVGVRRFDAARFAAQGAVWVARRLLRRSGSVIGGAVLLRLDPVGLAEKARGRRITLVTGTNGKSTTTAMVVAALRSRGPVATNGDGANTPNGLAWAWASSDAEEVVLEVDESWLPWAVEMLSPHTVVLLNLTRDQLHRKPEIRPLAVAWRHALATVPCVVANADDPAVVWAAAGSRHAEFIGGGAHWLADAVLCPSCRTLLQRRAERWYCTCGLERPVPTWEFRGTDIIVRGRKIGTYDALPGDANRANLVAALAAVRARVAPEAAIEAIASGVHEVAGRYAETMVAGRRVRLILAKNPAGWEAALGMLREGASIVVAVSAEGIDGRDTSWLYDVPFERLRGRPVAVAGSRGSDLALRLHLGDVESTDPLPSLDAAVRALPPGDVDLVATYAAFQTARRELHVG